MHSSNDPVIERCLDHLDHLSRLGEATAASHSESPASPSPSGESDQSTLLMVRQPDAKPISAEQLSAEVRGIYRGLVMLEDKCCEVNARQHQYILGPGSPPNLSEAQWYATVVLASQTLLFLPVIFFYALFCPTHFFFLFSLFYTSSCTPSMLTNVVS